MESRCGLSGASVTYLARTPLAISSGKNRQAESRFAHQGAKRSHLPFFSVARVSVLLAGVHHFHPMPFECLQHARDLYAKRAQSAAGFH
jgi:hypothetical protein